MTKKQTAEKVAAILELRKMIAPGQKIYTLLRHVSKSGMMRIITVKIIEDNTPRDITGLVATALSFSIDKKWWGIKSVGCGQDMGYALVCDMSYVLFPEGYQCIGEECYHNDHTNRVLPRDGKSFHPVSGYALGHAWL